MLFKISYKKSIFIIISIIIILFSLFIKVDKDHESLLMLDGGMGREIKKRGLPFNIEGTEWSASILLSNDKRHFYALSDIHLDFINSGANVITTSSYSITPHDIGKERFLKIGNDLIDKAISAADLARKKIW